MWRLQVDFKEDSVYHQFSAEDRALIDERLRFEITKVSTGNHIPIIDISTQLTAKIPDLKKPYRHLLDRGEMGRRIAQKGETLCRVTGASRGEAVRIFDATGGLCREAQLMSASGAHIWSSERSLPLYLLSKQALHQAGSKVHLIFGEARLALSSKIEPHTVYLDPMFPEAKKSAAVGKEAMILRAFAEQSDLEEESKLLEWAMSTAVCRVVVKRPLKAPVLAKVSPTASVRGKAIRFDIYGKRKLPKS